MQSKPNRSKLRKWLTRSVVLLIPLTITVLLLCTVGWPWVNDVARSYARSRMVSQLEESAEQIPEITDHAALINKEVTGSNGWEQLNLGRSRAWELEQRHADDPEGVYATHILNMLFDAYEEFPETLEEGALGGIKLERIPDLLAETEELAVIARAASVCDCIVPVNGPYWGREGMVHTFEFIGALATRVCALWAVNEHARCGDEMIVLVRLLSKINTRHSKEFAYQVHHIRNEVLQHCVIDILNAGGVSPHHRQTLMSLRWHTPGNDPVLWLNNAAWTYKTLCEMRDDESQNIAVSLYDKPPTFPRLHLYDYPGYTQLMEVCSRNAIDARNGELDLRNDEWVESYEQRFSIGYNPINYVVG